MGIVTLTLNPAVDVSASVDKLVPEHKLRCGDERRDAGGGGINVARALHRLGEKPLAIFPAGGVLGDVLEALVAAEDVNRLAIPIKGNTREDFAITESGTGLQYRFVLPGPTLTALEADLCCDAVRATLNADDYLIASGSLPPGLPGDFYARVAGIARECNARFVLDASGDALKLALRSGIHLIKPSRRELSDLAGKPLDTAQACVEEAARLVAKGAAAMIAVSLGSDGAVLVDQDKAFRAWAPQVKAVSSVGAGDSFLAGLIWSLTRGSEAGLALRFAVAAGSAALLSPGTGLCEPSDVVRLASDVRVEHLRAVLPEPA